MQHSVPGCVVCSDPDCWGVWSGGVATIVPVSFQVKAEEVIIPGRVLAVRLETDFWLINVYVFENEKADILQIIIAGVGCYPQ